MANDQFVTRPSSFFRHSDFDIRHSRAAGGFTFIELCLAMVVTAMVMGALAAFSLAMASAWRSAEQSQTLTMLGTQAVARLQHEIRDAKLIGECRPGSSDGSAAGAAVLLWKADTNNDGFIQGSELSLIEHNTATRELRYYPAGQADALARWQYNQFALTGGIALFKSTRTSTPLAAGICGAVFQATGTSGTTTNPALQFALKIRTDSPGPGGSPQELVQYGTATVRAPLAQPSY